jgi:D-alanyl-lipoteichoic acid acyltransferase DltB (MBOAT superfamily)
MTITSGSFVLFLAATLVVYYLLPRRAQNVWLLGASYAFCISWGWHFAVVLAVVTLVNYSLALRLRAGGQGRKGLLWAAIGFNVLTLVVFRTADFYVPSFQGLLNELGVVTELGVLQILLPIGLSFYIVQNISYQVDVYRGQTDASRDLVDFALYQAYFPKFLAGPIERAGSFLPKLSAARVVDNELLARSITLIAVGLFRKVVIADTLTGLIPPDVFEAPSFFSALDLWGWLIVYGFALYNDFAGYTSIVRGVSGLFGIELSQNFLQPYFSRNFGEFWNRWHMTLSAWLRDYIYFPTLRSLMRRNRSRTNVLNIVVPPMVTMLVSALWHGFSPNMLLWGGLHGVYQIGERLLALRGPLVPPDQRPIWRQLPAMGLVFLLVMWAWVPFRLPVPLALEYWQGMLTFDDFGMQYRRLIFAGGYVLAAVIVDLLQHCTREETLFLRWPRPVQGFLLATVIFLILILSVGSVTTPFVYQGF